jgi:hypothetical protein
MRPLAIDLSEVGRGLHKGDGGVDLTNTQYKPIQNYHNESPLHNKYMLIKMKKECPVRTKALLSHLA